MALSILNSTGTETQSDTLGKGPHRPLGSIQSLVPECYKSCFDTAPPGCAPGVLRHVRNHMTKARDQCATLEPATSPKSQWGRAHRNASLLYLEQSHIHVSEKKSPPSLLSLRLTSQALAPERKAACLTALGLEILWIVLSPSRAHFLNKKVYIHCFQVPRASEIQKAPKGILMTVLHICAHIPEHTHVLILNTHCIYAHGCRKKIYHGVRIPAAGSVCVYSPQGSPVSSDSHNAQLTPFPGVSGVLRSLEGPFLNHSQFFVLGLVSLLWVLLGPCYKTGREQASVLCC